MDAVLLPHTLEFAADPYAIVREVDRVLTGEGQLLVLGFAPWSPWGLRARLSRNGLPPGIRRVLSEKRVRDWLVLLGYEIVAAERYLFANPWGSGSAPGEGTGRYLRRGLNPFPAGAYLLKARKRVYTLTPIRPRFREKPAAIGGLVKPTTRSSSFFHRESHRDLHRRRLPRQPRAGRMGSAAALRHSSQGTVRQRAADDEQSHGADGGHPGASKRSRSRAQVRVSTRTRSTSSKASASGSRAGRSAAGKPLTRNLSRTRTCGSVSTRLRRATISNGTGCAVIPAWKATSAWTSSPTKPSMRC